MPIESGYGTELVWHAKHLPLQPGQYGMDRWSRFRRLGSTQLITIVDSETFSTSRSGCLSSSFNPPAPPPNTILGDVRDPFVPSQF